MTWEPGKTTLARLAIRLLLPRLTRDAHPLNRLLGQAGLTQLGRKPEHELREDLERFYRSLDPEACMGDIDFQRMRERLRQPEGYKVDVTGLCGDRSSDPDKRMWDLWARRFGLLRRLGVRTDVLVLRRGHQIPPHAHSRVVSGFYVLEGEVAIRHYDRVEAEQHHLLLRKVVDQKLGGGGFTTNSEFHHNIHWLLGLAPFSFLFRFTVTDVPLPSSGRSAVSDSRIYVDPTGRADENGLIRAPRISEEQAHRLPGWLEPR